MAEQGSGIGDQGARCDWVSDVAVQRRECINDPEFTFADKEHCYRLCATHAASMIANNSDFSKVMGILVARHSRMDYIESLRRLGDAIGPRTAIDNSSSGPTLYVPKDVADAFVASAPTGKETLPVPKDLFGRLQEAVNAMEATPHASVEWTNVLVAFGAIYMHFVTTGWRVE